MGGGGNPVSDNKIFSRDQRLMLLLLFGGYPILLSARTLKFATVLHGNTGIAGLPLLYHKMYILLPVLFSLLSNHSSQYVFWLLMAPLSKTHKRIGSPNFVDQ